MRTFAIALVLLTVTQTGCLAVGATLALQAAGDAMDRSANYKRCIEGHPAAEGLHLSSADPCEPARLDAYRCADAAWEAQHFDRDAWDACMIARGWDVHPRLWPLQPYGELREEPRRGQSEIQRAMGPSRRRR